MTGKNDGPGSGGGNHMMTFVLVTVAVIAGLLLLRYLGLRG